MEQEDRTGGQSRREALGAATALPLLGCRITLPRQDGAPRASAGAPGGGAPLRLGLPTGNLGDEQALVAWRAAATRLRETSGPAVEIEPYDSQVPWGTAVGPHGRVPALEHLFADDAALDAVVWTGSLPWERVALVDLGLAQPVDRLLRASRQGARGPLEEYSPGALDALRDGDAVYGLPVEATPQLLLADTQLTSLAPAARPLREARAEAWTWGAFEEASAQLLRLGSGGALALDSRWGFAPMSALPLDALLWQHGATVESGRRQDSGEGAGAWTPGQPGGPRLRIAEPAARAALGLYARLLRAALGPAATLPAGQRPQTMEGFQIGPSSLRVGQAPVAMSTFYGVPRVRLPATEGRTDPAAGTVVVAPLPRLPARVGTGDPAATQMRVNRFIVISPRAPRAAEAALALHSLVGVLSVSGGEAAPIPARLPAPGGQALPHLTYLPPAERTAIVEALAHSRSYPPRAELTLGSYVQGRVRQPLLAEPARAEALEEALAVLMQLGN